MVDGDVSALAPALLQWTRGLITTRTLHGNFSGPEHFLGAFSEVKGV